MDVSTPGGTGDYSKSILLTSDQYIQTMELKAKKKEDALIEAERRREEARHHRVAREVEKQRKGRERRPRRQRKHAQRRDSANSGAQKV